MVDAMIVVFNMAVEHCAVRMQAQLVGRAVNVDPVAGVRLVLANAIPDLGMKNLRPSPRHASQSGVDQVLENRLDALFGQMLKPIDLDGGPPLEVQPRS